MSAASALAESSEEKDRIAMNPVDEGTKIPDGMINITLFAEMHLRGKWKGVTLEKRCGREEGMERWQSEMQLYVWCLMEYPHISVQTDGEADRQIGRSTDLAKQTQALFIQFVRLFVFEEPAVIPTQTALSAPKAVAMNVQCQPIASVLTSSRAEPIPFTQRITKELKTDAKTTTITFVVKAAHIPIRPLKMLLLNCFSSAPTIPFPPSLPHTFMNKLSIPQIQMTSHFQVCIQQLSHFDISLSLSSLSQIFDVPYRIVPLIFLAAVELRRADAILAGFAKGNPVQQSIPIQALSSSSIDPVVLAAQDPFNKMPLNSAFCAASRQ